MPMARRPPQDRVTKQHYDDDDRLFEDEVMQEAAWGSDDVTLEAKLLDDERMLDAMMMEPEMTSPLGHGGDTSAAMADG